MMTLSRKRGRSTKLYQHFPSSAAIGQGNGGEKKVAVMGCSVGGSNVGEIVGGDNEIIGLGLLLARILYGSSWTCRLAVGKEVVVFTTTTAMVVDLDNYSLGKLVGE